jgi:RsiW-degrading membrane proteinase PrsW (M82 family)
MNGTLTADNALFYSIVAAVAPVLFYVALIYWVDRYEKEPGWLLSAAFLWGAIPAALLALVFNLAFSVPLYFIFDERAAEMAAAGVFAPVIEEVAKAVILFIILLVRRHELDSPLDGIIYGAMVGMGFAMVENVLYYQAAFSEDGPAGWNIVVVVRGIIFGLNHALYTAMTGLGIALAKISPNRLVRFGAPLLGLGTAIALHAFHNLTMFAGSQGPFLAGLLFDWSGVLLTLAIIFLALYQERRWMRHYLAEEVTLGTLSADEYRIVSSAALRNRHRLRLLFNEGLGSYRRSGRRFHTCSELAYRKRHHAVFPNEEGMVAIGRLREQLAGISQT